MKTSLYNHRITHFLCGRKSEKRWDENLVQSWNYLLSAWKDKKWNGEIKTSYNHEITHFLCGKTSEKRSDENLVIRGITHILCGRTSKKWSDKTLVVHTIMVSLTNCVEGWSENKPHHMMGSLTCCVEGQPRSSQMKASSYGLGSLTFCAEEQARNGQIKPSPNDHGFTYYLYEGNGQITPS
jgi:hypothetical protein